MVSALTQTHLIDSILANGADGYLHKPFQLAKLLNEVERVSALVRLRRNILVDQPSRQQQYLGHSVEISTPLAFRERATYRSHDRVLLALSRNASAVRWRIYFFAMALGYEALLA